MVKKVNSFAAYYLLATGATDNDMEVVYVTKELGMLRLISAYGDISMSLY